MGKASRQKKDREATPTEAKGRSAPRVSTRVDLAADASPEWLHAVAALTLIGLSWFTYYPSLTGEFVFDDHNAIQQSLLVRDIFPLARFLTYSNRPLADFTYAINYAQGGYDTWWFHFTNIAIHSLIAVLLYAIAARTLRMPTMAERYGPWSQAIGWSAAALFTVHPLATEAVAYISSRYESLAALFYLLTILVYTFAVASPNQKTRDYAKYGLAITTAMGVASKEIAATIPLALLLYDYLFVAGGTWGSTKTRLRLIGYSIILLVVGGTYFAVRAFSSMGGNTPYAQSAGFGFDRYTPVEFFATQLGVILHYLRLCFVPTNLTFDYDWPLSRPVLQPTVFLAGLAMAGIVALAVRSVRSQPLFAFFILFTLLVLAPTSSVMPLADLAVERRMYLPLAGFCLFLAGTLADLARTAIGSRGLVATAIATLALVSVGAYASQARAVVWGDHLLLYEDGIVKSPGSPRVRLNLGVIHLNAGRHDEAHDVLFKAKEIFDRGESIHCFPRIGAFIYYNLGAIQFIRGEYDDSEMYMRRSIAIGGRYVALRPRAYAVLGEIFRMRGQYDAAIESFEEALKYNTDYPDWNYALVETFLLANRPDDAKKALFTLEQTHPHLVGAKRGKDLLNDIQIVRRAQRQAEARAKDQKMREELEKTMNAPAPDPPGAQ